LQLRRFALKPKSRKTTKKLREKTLKKVAKRLWLLILLLSLLFLLLSGGIIYAIANATADRWQPLWWSNRLNSNLPLCLAPSAITNVPMTDQPANQPVNQPQKLKRLAFKPSILVVEPWRGQHNVYAVFAVPMAYREIYYRSVMEVKGIKTGWKATIADNTDMKIKPPEGQFLMISFFPTRLTLWYWLTGKFSHLQDPCNWTLYFFPL
jgi:hypothetical protein